MLWLNSNNWKSSFDSAPRTAPTLTHTESAAAAVVLPAMFPESSESDLCARPVGNLVNHQASGTLQYHQAGGTFGVLCGSYFFTTRVWSIVQG